MTINEWQSQVDTWIKHYGVRYFDIKTNALLLVEEIGELMRYISRIHGEQSFKNPEDAKNAEDHLKDEMGDVIFVLTCLSNQLGYDLDELLRQNIAKKTDRDKSRHMQNKKLKD